MRAGQSGPRPTPPVLDLRDVAKTYGQGETEVRAIDGISLQVHRGDYVAIMGPSGSGKSSLMHIIGCLDVASHGSYRLDGLDVRQFSENQLSMVRNRQIGFVFQSFNLIPRTSALRNVELPLAYRGVSRRQRRERAQAALAQVGLQDRATHTPAQLSGGQQQRVAVARAIVSEPVLLLADEPTGALDSRSTAEMLDLFDALSAQGRTIVVITHETEVADRAKRVLSMRDGLIDADERRLPVHEPHPRLRRVAS